jgi:hypothetical protein
MMDAELHKSIGRLEGKVDLLIDMHKDNTARVRDVERKAWWFTGVAAGAAALLTKAGLTGLWPH